MQKIQKTDTEWRAELDPKAYEILRLQGTERPGTGELLHNKAQGEYVCGGCGVTLFASDTKFDSGSGWPSFTDPANREHVTLITDGSHGITRTEVRCAACDGHLGHVFPDGPGESGERYCINSCALEFRPAE